MSTPAVGADDERERTLASIEAKKAEMLAAMNEKRQEMAKLGAEVMSWLDDTSSSRNLTSTSSSKEDKEVQTDPGKPAPPVRRDSMGSERSEGSDAPYPSRIETAPMMLGAGGRRRSSLNSVDFLPALAEKTDQDAQNLRMVLAQARRSSVRQVAPQHAERSSSVLSTSGMMSLGHSPSLASISDGPSPHTPSGGKEMSALDRHIRHQRRLTSVTGHHGGVMGQAPHHEKGPAHPPLIAHPTGHHGHPPPVRRRVSIHRTSEMALEQLSEESEDPESMVACEKVETIRPNSEPSKEVNRDPKQGLTNHMMAVAFERAKRAKEAGDVTVPLPRGGTYVNTRSGALQIGIPPETIKDCMLLGLQLPRYYVVPKERFNRRAGINVAEFEFPTYFNFFVLKNKLNLITDAETEPQIRNVMQETLFGPADPNEYLDEEFAADPYRQPDLAKELGHFRMNPFKPTERMEIDTLQNFLHFDENNTVTIGEGDTAVKIVFKADEYHIMEDDKTIATVSDIIDLQSHVVTETSSISKLFELPTFGVTLLGTSHGFDPVGSTTGFVIWMSGRGIMVDPPPNSGALLRSEGIPARLIDTVILTHCHADHDAGTFQKILDEQRVTIMTTPTIMNSFLRKYAAIAELESELLKRLFVFQEVLPAEKIKVHGGTFRFQYSLHSIPCLGFKVKFGGSSLVYSADTCYIPEKIDELQAKGIFSQGRRDTLVKFPWESTVILHEAGVPPIHTPPTELGKLPEDVRNRIHVVHTAKDKFPWDTGLRIAACGVENTIVIPVDEDQIHHAAAIGVIDLVSSLDIFRPFPMCKAIDVLQCYHRVTFSPGQPIDVLSNDLFYVIESGLVKWVEKSGGKYGSKILTTGDYFGEVKIVLGAEFDDTSTELRVICLTNVQVIAFRKEDFMCLIRDTDAEERIEQLVNMRTEMSWEVLNANKVLCKTTESQKTQLQAIMGSEQYAEGEVIWAKGEPANFAILVKKGTCAFTDSMFAFGMGTFLGEVGQLIEEQDEELQTTVKALEYCEVYKMPKEDLADFWMYNPGVLLNFLGQLFVE